MAEGRGSRKGRKHPWKLVFVAVNLIVFILDVILLVKLNNPRAFSLGEETTGVVLNIPTEEITTAPIVQLPPEESTEEVTEKPTEPSTEETTQKDTEVYGPRIIIDIEYFNQNNFPTFCEGVTTLMALRYMGYDMTIDRLIEDYVPSFELTKKNNVLIGEDPNVYFIGDPRSSDAKGCYAPVIKNVITEIAGESAIHDLTGMDIEDILSQYVNKGFPVIFWATMYMKESGTGDTWYIERTGEYFTWKTREHCLLLAGSDPDNYYFYDPLNNHGVISYDKELVEKRYEELGKMALALVKRGDGK